jgi:hypothetical protein
MPLNNMKKYIFAAAAAIAVHGAAIAQTRSAVGIEEARTRRILEYKGEVMTQSSGRKLKLNLKNRSKDSLYVHIEAGRTFMPEKAGYQPLVVTRAKTVKLGPGESRSVHVNALCGDAPKKSAGTGDTEFNRSQMTGNALQNILNFMTVNRLEGFPGTQSVIWAFTNNHQVAGITQNGLDQEYYDILMKEVARQAGKSVPWYRLFYKEPPADSDILFTDEAIRLEGKIGYKIEEPTDVHFVLADMENTWKRNLKFINMQNPGEYNMPLAVGLENLTKGEYKIAVENAEGKILSELPFRI